ncbi:RNA polymerase sigma factor [Porticoccaceae bacterium]|nr:RNA polymerase sigma factor [Porticoccaceae bacterium]
MSVEYTEKTMLTDETNNKKTMAATYERLRGSLMRYTSRYFRKSHEIEDVVQEAFVKVLEAQGDRTIRSIDAYLFRTARNVALSKISKHENKLTDALGELMTESDLALSPTLEQDYEARQQFELFCESLVELPKRCQQAFVLRRVYGFSQAEIAERMDISVNTVEMHLAKGVVRCEHYMRKQSGDHNGELFKRKHGSSAKL